MSDGETSQTPASKPPPPASKPPPHAIRAKRVQSSGIRRIFSGFRRSRRSKSSGTEPAAPVKEEGSASPSTDGTKTSKQAARPRTPTANAAEKTDGKRNRVKDMGRAFANLWTRARNTGRNLVNRVRQNLQRGERLPPPEPTVPYNIMLPQFYKAINSRGKIDEKLVRKFSFKYGAPETAGMRSIMWKLLLDYLPFDRTEWPKVLKAKRQLYRDFVKELVSSPYAKFFGDRAGDKDGKTSESAKEGGAKGGGAKEGEVGSDASAKPSSNAHAAQSASGATAIPVQDVSAEDDPLSPEFARKKAEWDQFFKDEELREEVHKDVMRTYASFSFFLQRVRNPSSRAVDEAKGVEIDPRKHRATVRVKTKAGWRDKKVLLFPPCFTETHHDVLQRILYIYAKLNPGVRYVQGMNEILAPIYFCFAQDQSDKDFRLHAEADAFFCFCNVMMEIRDRFIKSLDSTSTGIIQTVKDLDVLVSTVDKELHAHLRKLNIDPRFYAFRWLTLMLSQEFELPDVLRIWDSLFADEKRFQFLTYCCAAMLLIYRDRLLAGGFATNLRLLQDYPSTDLHQILNLAAEIRRRTPSLELAGSNNQQLVKPVDLDKHLGITPRR